MQHPAWTLVIIGLIIAAIGGLWLLLPAGTWLGRLPGDIVIERDNFRFYLPLMTCIVISLLLSGIAWLVRYMLR